MNYVYCVFICIYVYIDVCQRVCCIDSSGFIYCALSMSSQLYQWSKMTVTENRGAHAIVQIDEMCHLNGFHLPPDEPIGEKEENIVG